MFTHSLEILISLPPVKYLKTQNPHIEIINVHLHTRTVHTYLNGDELNS